MYTEIEISQHDTPKIQIIDCSVVFCETVACLKYSGTAFRLDKGSVIHLMDVLQECLYLLDEQLALKNAK